MNKYMLKMNFYELKEFIEACLGEVELTDYEGRKYLTTDHKSLMDLTERLSYLLDQPNLGIALPEFSSWVLPEGIHGVKQDKFQLLEKRRYEEYRRDIEEYITIIKEARGEFGSGHKVIAGFYSKIENRTDDKLWSHVVKLPWQLLPISTGERFSEIVKHYKKLEEISPGIKYDFDRLYKVYELNADHIYIGTDEFEGYVVFYFDRIKSAILECPIYGNAIYVFENNWIILSKMSKAALLGQNKFNIKRIFHNGDWFSRLEWLIKSRLERADLVNAVR